MPGKCSRRDVGVELKSLGLLGMFVKYSLSPQVGCNESTDEQMVVCSTLETEVDIKYHLTIENANDDVS